jgi:hypothetical protein
MDQRQGLSGIMQNYSKVQIAHMADNVDTMEFGRIPFFYYFLLIEFALQGTQLYLDERRRSRTHGLQQLFDGGEFNLLVFASTLMTLASRYRSLWTNLVMDACLMLFIMWLFLTFG